MSQHRCSGWEAWACYDKIFMSRHRLNRLKEALGRDMVFRSRPRDGLAGMLWVVTWKMGSR